MGGEGGGGRVEVGNFQFFTQCLFSFQSLDLA